MNDLMDDWEEKYVRVMFDFCSTGLWAKGGWNMPYETLPISKELVDKFKNWMIKVDKAVFPDDHLPVPELWEEGLELAKSVKQELPDWTVVYFDEGKLDFDRDDQHRSEYEYEIL